MMKARFGSYFVKQVGFRHLTHGAKTFCLVLLVVLGLNIFTQQADAQVVNTAIANFTDGNGTSSTDAFIGTGGDGWAGEWKIAERGSFVGSETVLTPSDSGYQEIHPGDGNYLQLHLESSSPTDGSRLGVARSYKGSIDCTENHTIEFTVRINEWGIDQTYSYMDTEEDRYAIAVTNTVRSLPDSSDTFVIQALGDGTTWGDQVVRKWAFANGDCNGGITDYVGSGINLTDGGIYDFTVFVDVNNCTYDVTVGDGTTSFTAEDLGFITSTGKAGGYLNFSTTCNVQSDIRQMSIDNIRVEQSILSPGGVDEVVAYFNDGNVTSAVDGFTGTGGNGWKSGWKVVERDDVTINATVITSADTGFQEVHPGDGNYLKVDMSSTDGYARGSIARSYKTGPGIDYTEDHKIEFTIRIDEENIGDAGNTTMANEKDRYAITGSDTERTYPSGSDTFAIFATGDASTWGDQVVRKWAFANGDGDGGITEYVGSGIDLVQGGVYDFIVTMNVEDRTYDVTVDDGTSTFTANDLMWMTSLTEIGGVLNFAATCDSFDDYRSMSIDNIRISSMTSKIPGDANNDGKVDGSDVTLLANNWQAGIGNPNPTTITWEMGDFNGDGQVDGSDVTILANNWQYGVTSAAASVPEPSMIALVLVGLAMLVIRKRFF